MSAGRPSIAPPVGARAVSGIAALARVLSEQVVEYGFRSPEIRSFQLFDRLTEINQASIRREVQYAQCARNSKASLFRRPHTLAIIHQQQVGMESEGQLNSGFLTSVDCRQRGVVGVTQRSITDFQPRGRSGYPIPHERRRFTGDQFVMHSGGKDHSFKQGGQQIHVSNQDQIIYRTSVGDYHLHRF
jgi:hypothetical protein